MEEFLWHDEWKYQHLIISIYKYNIPFNISIYWRNSLSPLKNPESFHCEMWINQHVSSCYLDLFTHFSLFFPSRQHLFWFMSDDENAQFFLEPETRKVSLGRIMVHAWIAHFVRAHVIWSAAWNQSNYVTTARFCQHRHNS